MDSVTRLVILTISLFASAPGFAHEGTHPENGQQRGTRVLGRIDFPTTTQSVEAQDAFVRGVLLLHLFEYPFAEKEFQRAREIDPGFAMAYWGEAITHNHPIWDEQDRDKAMAVMNQLGPSAEARNSKTASQKEKDYLASLEILYGQGSKAERDKTYMRHLAQMAQDYPDDHEVRLFYALSIMGASAGVRDIPAYIESAAHSQSVFYANREHPGAAHYFIHAVDDPVHAPLALEAARALAVMAPDAGHSLHMTSHIFTALGMWDDVVNANTEAVRVANAMAAELGRPARHFGHYNFWLLYGLLQLERETEAKALLETAYDEVTRAGAVPRNPLVLDPDSSPVGSVVQMWARYLIETRGEDATIAAWTFNMGEAYDPQLNFHYVHGLLASRSDQIHEHFEAFVSLKTRLRDAIMAMPRQAPTDLLYLDRLDVITQQLEAMLARAGDDTEAMLDHAREASRLEGLMPASFGPPFVDYPSAQMLGELLLGLGRYDEAAEAFGEQLKRSRRKTQAMEGLAQAESRAGDALKASGSD